MRAGTGGYAWAGVAFHFAGPDAVIWFFSVYFLAMFLIPIGIGAWVSYRALPTGRDCPRCSASTSLILSTWARAASRVPGVRIQNRWCLECGWAGYLRSERPSLRLVVDRRTTAARVIDVRPLLVDGIWWRVRLETWRTQDRWLGRLVFVEPSGRVWLDGRSLGGPSDHELLRRARLIPRDQLTSRLRGLVSG